MIDLPNHYKFLCRCVDTGIKQISVLGSMHEVGFYEESINENTPTDSQSLYGISKDNLRKSIQLKCKESNVVFQWLRGV